MFAAALRDGVQRLVASRMPIGVVDLFEMIDIEQQRAQWLRETCGMLPFLLGCDQERTAVGNAG